MAMKKTLEMVICTRVVSCSAVLRSMTVPIAQKTAAVSARNTGSDSFMPVPSGSQAMSTPTKPMKTANQRIGGTSSFRIGTASSVTMIGAA
ncbi:hypothetical protein D9M72_352590 [compost metagenome]